jgi:hypothetical protein
MLCYINYYAEANTLTSVGTTSPSLSDTWTTQDQYNGYPSWGCAENYYIWFDTDSQYWYITAIQGDTSGYKWRNTSGDSLGEYDSFASGQSASGSLTISAPLEDDGGCLVGSIALWSVANSWKSCSCSDLQETAIGGCEVGGIAIVVLERIEGGCVVGGSASVSIPGDVYDGLIFCLPLDELPTTFLDRTRNELDGEGDTTAIASGVACNPCQELDGSTFILLDSDSMPNQSFAVSLWVKPTKKYQERIYYARGNSFRVGIAYSNVAYASITGTSETLVYGTTAMATDRWYHIAVEWDASIISLYINGVLEASENTDSTITPLVGNCYLGSWNGYAKPQTYLQEVRLYGSVKGADWWETEYNSLCDNGFIYQGVVES